MLIALLKTLVCLALLILFVSGLLPGSVNCRLLGIRTSSILPVTCPLPFSSQGSLTATSLPQTLINLGPAHLLAKTEDQNSRGLLSQLKGSSTLVA